MREITSDGGKGKEDAAPESMTDEERGKALKAAWEAMLVEGMNANASDLANLGEEMGSSKEKAAGGAFQDKIKQAMDKLKDSESKMGGASPGAAPTPESLEALLQSLGDLGLGGEGGDEKELAGFLETMMSQLMSKDVLYDPLKELAEGFPPFLMNPPKPLSDDDKKRYDNQLVCVRKILVVFEKQDYNDSHEEYGKQIVDLMSEMQTYGSPPSEIMGPLPPGFDAMGSEEGCTIA
ncbi:hypothetical protein NLJ89_g11180 [Agrocybe chaxingu]|uniref:Peroxin-19 n=1 Tax=Agrocybe chaxingu TaxID=84603 RepID=A0A9W8JQG1_9AGAR|nr:hypothetical protein NLJ89_g11180 [Agrocybe chaxingu]